MAEEETFKVTDRRGRERPTAAPPSEPEAAPPPEPAPPPRADRPRPDLSGLFVMFAQTALIGLGAPNPASGERAVDLEQARDAIDLLLLLRDKTTGNRTDDESRLLEHILYDLQMRYVEASGRART